MMSILDRQLEELRQVYPAGAEAKPLPSGAVLIELKSVALPQGWNKPNTSIRFIVPVGYPFAAQTAFGPIQISALPLQHSLKPPIFRRFLRSMRQDYGSHGTFRDGTQTAITL